VEWVNYQAYQKIPEEIKTENSLRICNSKLWPSNPCNFQFNLTLLLLSEKEKNFLEKERPS